jgi:hypothetical protein
MIYNRYTKTVQLIDNGETTKIGLERPLGYERGSSKNVRTSNIGGPLGNVNENTDLRGIQSVKAKIDQLNTSTN